MSRLQARISGPFSVTVTKDPLPRFNIGLGLLFLAGSIFVILDSVYMSMECQSLSTSNKVTLDYGKMDEGGTDNGATWNSFVGTITCYSDGYEECTDSDGSCGSCMGCLSTGQVYYGDQGYYTSMLAPEDGDYESLITNSEYNGNGIDYCIGFYHTTLCPTLFTSLGAGFGYIGVGASMLSMIYVAVAYFTAEDASLTDSREKENGALEVSAVEEAGIQLEATLTVVDQSEAEARL